MTDVFISYASEDRLRVAPLVVALEARGWSVWWDRHVAVGHQFDRDIEAAIDGARCVVVVWSRHSVESDWVRAEANEGLERNVLVPVAFDDVRPPLAFRRLQTLALNDIRADLPSLINGVAALIGAQHAAVQSSVPISTEVRGRPRVLLLGWQSDQSDAHLVSFAHRLNEEIAALGASFAYFESVEAEPALRLQQAGKGPAAIARSLGADYVVSGRVEQQGNEREVLVRVAHAANEQQTNSTAVAPTHLTFAEQRSLIGEILMRITGDIQTDLTGRLAVLPVEQLDRWGLLLTGRSSPDGIARLKRAVDLYPQFGLARATLAAAGALGMTVGWPRELVGIEMVKDNVDHALRENPQNVEVLSQCGYALSLIGEADLGLPLIEEATVRFYPAQANLVFPYTRLGRAAEAIKLFEQRARWGLPMTPIGWAGRTEAYIVDGRFEQAVDFARRGVLRAGQLEMPMWGHLANALGHLARYDEARDAWQRAKQLVPRLTLKSWARGWGMQFKDPALSAPLIDGLIRAGLT